MQPAHNKSNMANTIGTMRRNNHCSRGEVGNRDDGLPFAFGTGVGRSFLKDRIQRHSFGGRDRPSVFWIIQEDGVRFEHVCLFLGNVCEQCLDVVGHDVDVSGIFQGCNFCMDGGGGEGSPEGGQTAGQPGQQHGGIRRRRETRRRVKGDAGLERGLVVLESPRSQSLDYDVDVDVRRCVCVQCVQGRFQGVPGYPVHVCIQ